MEFKISLTDIFKRLGSYDKIESFKWGRSANKSEQWRKIREELLEDRNE